jgi:hypothetical protein
VDRIDSAEARDHLEMVDRILSESSQRLCYGGEYFVVWGVYSAFAMVSWHLLNNRMVPAWTIWIQAAALVAAIAFSAVRGRMKRRERLSIVQREFFNVLWLTLGMAFVCDFAAIQIFKGPAAAAVWSVGAAIVLLFIGMHGNRRAQVAGVLVVVSLVVANFVAPSICEYVLAGGMLVGYAGFGVVELLARD